MKLFEPGRIGKLSLKNRIVMAPMLTGLAEPIEDGRMSQRDIDFYLARARGGVGLIITSFMRTNRRFEASLGEPVVNSQRCVRWLNDLAEAMHDYGVKVCAQLSAGMGRNQPLPESWTKGRGEVKDVSYRPVSASAVPSFWGPDTICHALSKEEIQQLIQDYEFSAKIIASAGIDAIEIHCHAGYLIDQFLTAIWNKRTDEYGGNLKNRFRFTQELIDAIRRGAGDDFPISYRYAFTHYFDGGRDIEEGLEVARMLEAAGVDVLHIDAGSYESMHWSQPTTTQEPGCLVHLAGMAKKVVKIPIIIVGKLGYPEVAETVLKEGKADFIALGRPLLADPEWPNKVKEGRLEDVNPCLACHEGCLRRVFEGKHVSCAVNPAAGMEKEFTLMPAEKKKAVLVVGGGPAGMEAARVAALRGHRVTLIEKGYSLGGNLVPAAIPDFKQDYKRLLDYLITQVRKAGVNTRLGQEATPELIEKMNPDVVLIATGATPIVPEYPGMKEAIENGKAVTSVDVLLGKREVGDSVVVLGGGLVGCETGLWLAQKGRRVTVIARHAAMRDLFWINAMDLQEKLNAANVKILTHTNVIEITDEGLVIADKEGNRSALAADTIVLAVRLEPNRELLGALEDRLPEVYAIGDCVESRKVLDAVREGFRTARLI